MRIVGLLAVVAVIGFAYSRRVKTHDSNAELNEVMSAAATPVPVALVAGATPAPAVPSQPSSGLRRPIDTTRQVLDKVKARNGDGEF